jgi:hypothetical protein
VPVGESGPQSGTEHRLDADLSAESPAEHVEHARNDAVHIETLRL